MRWLLLQAKVEVEAKEKELSEDEARKLLSDRVGEADLEVRWCAPEAVHPSFDVSSLPPIDSKAIRSD